MSVFVNHPQMKRSFTLAAVLGLVSCAPSSQTSDKVQSLYAENPHNFRLSLTDAPKEDLKSVFVNVKHAEMRLSGGGKEARLVVAKNLGSVDLLTLQNGVTLPMADLSLPENVTVTQIRLVLEETDNYIIKMDGSRCDLKTPSAQKTGVKFIIKNGITVEKGYSYSIVADFDAKKSVVLQGNGGCLLKPVVKLKSASRIELPPPGDDDGGTPDDGATPDDGEPTDGTGTDPGVGTDPGAGTGEEPIAGEDDSEQVGDEDGYDIVVDPDNLPPEISEDELSIYF